MTQQHKAVLVSGASGGIGSATVWHREQLGWRAFAGVRTPEAGEKLARGRPGSCRSNWTFAMRPPT